MIVISLKKHIPTEKMFVQAWIYMPKEKAASAMIVPGLQAIVELSDVPEGFYKNSYRYFYEDGRLRNGFGINED